VDKYDPGYEGIPMVMPNYGRADVFTAAELRNMVSRYKAEVEMVSKWIGFVIRQIKDVGMYDESMIIFTSDHGVLLGEHNRTGKLNIAKTDPRGPWPLFEEMVHVPLLVKMPGQQYKGKVIFGKVDVESNPQMASYLGIRSIPTMIFFSKGEEQERLVGSFPKSHIQKRIDHYAGK